MRPHINHYIINLLPPKLFIQSQTHGRSFDIRPRLIPIRGRKSLTDEHCAETLALVGWEDD